jgi:RND family efflux transporter MFP subunit
MTTSREAHAEARGSVTFLDPALWQSLAAERPSGEFARAWLTLQCRTLARVERGVLALRDQGKLVPAARWPEGDGGSPAITKTCELALAHAKGVASAAGDGARGDTLAFPLVIDGVVEAVAALECAPSGEAGLRDSMRQLQWGMATVEAVIRRGLLAQHGTRLAAAITALEIAASTLTAERFEDAARTLATELANRVAASRVAVGWYGGRKVRVVALSHALAFSRRMDAIRLIAAAMEEAIDQERSIEFPVPDSASPLGTSAHAALSRAQEDAAIISVPLVGGDRIVGAILLEWSPPAQCSQDSVNLVEATAGLLSPILAIQHRGERWLLVQLWDSLLRQWKRLAGPENYALKLSIAAILAVVAFFSTYSTEYRVAARATLEGETRRTLAAGLDGYVASENARAGQIVHKGEVLATLDSSELKLQRLRWIAEREQHGLAFDKAVGSGERAEANIEQAQVNEATAQIALLDEQIARTEIVAPFDGLVLSGDLSQSVGSAVQRTEALFEIAPLEAYRVVAHVPESDIDHLRPGQEGALALTALPSDRYSFKVQTITPEATVVDGVNTFRVEGQLEGDSSRLRPNMEGVARIAVGENLLIWIWSHKLIAALRLWLWSWWP